MGRLLEREGLLERDTKQLDLGEVLDQDDPMPDLVGHSITDRVGVGPDRGRKVFTLQTLPTCREEDWTPGGPGNVAGFSLHAGVAVKCTQRAKLERLCRYICRPPVSEKRLFLTLHGDIGYTLKTPYRDGTTHVIFEPLDFIPRLAARTARPCPSASCLRQTALGQSPVLVPPPRLNLTRFHGVSAPDSPYRARITPARRGRGAKPTKQAQIVERASRATGGDAMGQAAQACRRAGTPNIVLGMRSSARPSTGSTATSGRWERLPSRRREPASRVADDSAGPMAATRPPQSTLFSRRSRSTSAT